MSAMRFLCLALLMIPCLAPAKEATPTPAPTPTPVPAPIILSVDDTAAIQASMGKTITVEGKVLEAFWVKGTIMLITFRAEKTGFLAVVLSKNKTNLNDAFSGDMANALKGKTVRITGTVSDHKSRPQIEIEKAEQVKVL
jgi:DNA/RNA endonuclease YhcR with UshA esterase domain